MEGSIWIGRGKQEANKKVLHVYPMRPSDVLAAIDTLRREFFEAFDGGQSLPPIQIVAAEQRALDSNGIWRVPATKRIRLNSGRSNAAYARTWLLIEFVEKLVRDGLKTTLRETFYALISNFSSYDQFIRHARELPRILGCTLHDIRLIPANRGFVVGSVRVKLFSVGHSEWIDTRSLGSRGYSICGDLDELVDIDASQARFVLVVEKDAVYYRLAEMRLYEMVPCVLITGCGFPDLATRYLLRRIHNRHPQLPILGLSDWNHGGISVLMTYSAGSARACMEGDSYTVPLHRIGLNFSDFKEASTQEDNPLLLPLSKLENERIQSLLSCNSFVSFYPTFAAELNIMIRTGKKADIEILLSTGPNSFVRHVLASCLRNC